VFQARAVNTGTASITFDTVKLNGSRTFVQGYTVGQANLYRAAPSSVERSEMRVGEVCAWSFTQPK